MIQRKQTLFLLLTVVVSLVCIWLPVGVYVPQSLNVDSTMYNMWILKGDGNTDFSTFPLIILQLMGMLISIFTIFMYNKRKLQIKLCNVGMIVYIIWYAAYALLITQDLLGDNVKFHVSFAAVLPLVCIVLLFMARKGVKDDEALLRAAERLR